MPGAIATVAMADEGTLLHAPDVYMEKIAIGPGYPKGVVDLDAPAGDNILKLAKAKGVRPENITALILDRPRHADMIAAVRKVGGAVRLITDGDVAGGIGRAASEAISASVVRPRACWRRRRCAASAGRCNAGWCSTPRSGACAPPRWV